MLEAEPIHGVVELDIDAQVVGIKLQLVAWREAAAFVHVHRERRDRPGEAQAPMPIRGPLGSKVDHLKILPLGRNAL